MGPVAEPLYAVMAVAALGEALRQLGWPCDVGGGVEAALATLA
jgi:pyridoxamine--pyruvate transaminase